MIVLALVLIGLVLAASIIDTARLGARVRRLEEQLANLDPATKETP